MVQTTCKHIFHLSCLMRRVLAKWPTPRITFFFLECPACKDHMSAPYCAALSEEIKKFKELETVVKGKALDRAKTENLAKDPRFLDPNYTYHNNLQGFGMYLCAFYMCFKCQVPYFGGLKDCLRAAEERD